MQYGRVVIGASVHGEGQASTLPTAGSTHGRFHSFYFESESGVI